MSKDTLVKKIVFTGFIFISFLFLNCAMLSSRLAISNCQFKIADVGAVQYNPLKNLDNLGLTLNIACKNPNQITEAVLDKLNLILYVNGQKTTSGNVENVTRIPPASTVQIPLSIQLSLSQVGKTIFDVVNSGKAAYELRGAVLIPTPIGEKSLPVTITQGSWSSQ